MIPADTPTIPGPTVRLWQKTYLEEKYKLQGRDLSEITDQILEHMFIECRMCAVVSKQYIVWPKYKLPDFSFQLMFIFCLFLEVELYLIISIHVIY